jgi:hypothetical protein
MEVACVVVKRAQWGRFNDSSLRTCIRNGAYSLNMMEIAMLSIFCGIYRLHVLGMSDIELHEYTYFRTFCECLARKLVRRRQGKTLTQRHVGGG